MTLKDDEKFCIPCKKIGLDRKAHRIMPGGGGRCDEQGLPQLSDESKRFIELCKQREKNPTGSPAELEAQFDRVDPISKRTAAPHKDDALFRRIAANGDNFTSMIESLKKKRAVIDDAIEKCENARAALEKLT